MRVPLRTTIAALAIGVCGALAPAAAQAAPEAKPPFEIKPGSLTVSTSSDAAGAHADVTSSFEFVANNAGAVGGLLRNVEVILPIGFAGYPANVKTCTPAELQTEACPVNSQIGTEETVLRQGSEEPGAYVTFRYPLYNMNPSPGETAVYAFTIEGLVTSSIVLSVGPEYRVHATAFEHIHHRLRTRATGAHGVGRAGCPEPQRAAHVGLY